MVQQHQQELAYRVYISDSLFYLAQGKGLNMKYHDLINPKPVDHRSGDEIAQDVIHRLGLKVGNDGNNSL